MVHWQPCRPARPGAFVRATALFVGTTNTNKHRSDHQQAAAKKAGRETKEGLIGVALSPCGTEAAMVELNSETDFVARNDVFQVGVQAPPSPRPQRQPPANSSGCKPVRRCAVVASSLSQGLVQRVTQAALDCDQLPSTSASGETVDAVSAVTPLLEAAMSGGGHSVDEELKVAPFVRRALAVPSLCSVIVASPGTRSVVRRAMAVHGPWRRPPLDVAL